MPNKLRFIFIGFFVLVGLVCILGILGVNTSLKYEVEEANLLLKINHGLTADQRNDSVKEIESLSRDLHIFLYLYIFGAVACFLAAIGLGFYRQKNSNITWSSKD